MHYTYSCFTNFKENGIQRFLKHLKLFPSTCQDLSLFERTFA